VSSLSSGAMVAGQRNGWLKEIGYPCSVYASDTLDCTLGTGASELLR